MVSDKDRVVVHVPAGVLRGIRRIQSAGEVNYYSTSEVMAEAERLGEKEALRWINTHPFSYLHGAYNAFIEET